MDGGKYVGRGLVGHHDGLSSCRRSSTSRTEPSSITPPPVSLAEALAARAPSEHSFDLLQCCAGHSFWVVDDLSDVL